jgi:hypothetical protein
MSFVQFDRRIISIEGFQLQIPCKARRKEFGIRITSNNPFSRGTITPCQLASHPVSDLCAEGLLIPHSVCCVMLIMSKQLIKLPSHFICFNLVLTFPLDSVQLGDEFLTC